MWIDCGIDLSWDFLYNEKICLLLTTPKGKKENVPMVLGLEKKQKEGGGFYQKGKRREGES